MGRVGAFCMQANRVIALALGLLIALTAGTTASNASVPSHAAARQQQVATAPENHEPGAASVDGDPRTLASASQLIAHVFRDDNMNGIQDGGELDLPDWGVNYCRQTWCPTWWEYTDAQGDAVWAVRPATYRVRASIVHGWEISSEAVVRGDYAEVGSVAVPEEGAGLADFGYAKLPIIEVQMFWDKDEDAALDAEEELDPLEMEQRFSGWPFELYRCGEAGCELVDEQVTDGHGKVVWTGATLVPGSGSYEVVQRLGEGVQWHSTTGEKRTADPDPGEHLHLQFGVNCDCEIHATVSGEESVCEGEEARLQVDTTGTTCSGDLRYEWLKRDNSSWLPIAGAPDADSYSIEDGGMYAVKVLCQREDWVVCEELSNPVRVRMSPFPGCFITGPTEACRSERLVYSAPAGADRYDWFVDGRLEQGGPVNSLAWVPERGIHTIELLVTKDGCTTSCTKKVEWDPIWHDEFDDRTLPLWNADWAGGSGAVSRSILSLGAAPGLADRYPLLWTEICNPADGFALEIRFRYRTITAYGTTIGVGTSLYDGSRYAQGDPPPSGIEDVLSIHQSELGVRVRLWDELRWEMGPADTFWHTVQVERGGSRHRPRYSLTVDGMPVGSVVGEEAIPRSIFLGNPAIVDYPGAWTELEVDYVRISTGCWTEVQLPLIRMGG